MQISPPNHGGLLFCSPLFFPLVGHTVKNCPVVSKQARYSFLPKLPLCLSPQYHQPQKIKNHELDPQNTAFFKRLYYTFLVWFFDGCVEKSKLLINVLGKVTLAILCPNQFSPQNPHNPSNSATPHHCLQTQVWEAAVWGFSILSSLLARPILLAPALSLGAVLFSQSPALKVNIFLLLFLLDSSSHEGISVRDVVTSLLMHAYWWLSDATIS